MQDTQNALYINDRDPTNAVVFDVPWLARRSLARAWSSSAPSHRRCAATTGGSTSRGIARGWRPSSCRPTTRRSVTGRRRSCAPAPTASAWTASASDGEMPAPTRQPLPPLDPVYVELQGAKEYIASLEAENAALRAAAAQPQQQPSGARSRLQRLRSRLGR